MKNIKVLGLAIIASLVAAPVFAGETYVRNEWTDTETITKTDLDLKSTTDSIRLEKYDSFANKVYYEGSKEVSHNYDDYGSSETTSYGDGYSVHVAGSNLWGTFAEKVNTVIKGDILSISTETSKAHETSAGVR